MIHQYQNEWATLYLKSEGVACHSNLYAFPFHYISSYNYEELVA